MQITLVRNVAINGEHHDAGELLELDDALAATLVQMTRAVAGWPDEEAQPAKNEAINSDQQSVQPETKVEVAAITSDEQAVQPEAKAKKAG